LLRIINQRLPLKTKVKPSIIVLDETQDMTPLYYAFIKKSIVDMNPSAQLLVLGDTLQCIYDFPQKGADRRFLTLADQVFVSPNTWVRHGLHTSYRITKPMAWYVNERMLGYPRMRSVKPSPFPVRYVTGDPFHSVPNYLCDEIRMMLVTGVVKPDDIFVLAPSIRGTNESNPIKILENLLVKAAVPCYAPMSDDEAIKDDVVKGKVVFSSFHQSKGLERKVVIVGSFSTAYYFVARDAPREYCPNVLYGVRTRRRGGQSRFRSCVRLLRRPRRHLSGLT
jgi:superfamily I DNA/RNA helicase